MPSRLLGEEGIAVLLPASSPCCTPLPGTAPSRTESHCTWLQGRFIHEAGGGLGAPPITRSPTGCRRGAQSQHHLLCCCSGEVKRGNRGGFYAVRWGAQGWRPCSAVVTFLPHPHTEALLQAAVLALVAVVLVDLAVTVGPAGGWEWGGVCSTVPSGTASQPPPSTPSPPNTHTHTHPQADAMVTVPGSCFQQTGLRVPLCSPSRGFGTAAMQCPQCSRGGLRGGGTAVGGIPAISYGAVGPGCLEGWVLGGVSPIE